MANIILALVLMQQAFVEGNSRSAVRVVIYEDLQCEDCARFRTMLDTYLLPKFGNRVAFEHRDFPLPKHDWAKRAAQAARQFDQARPGAGSEFRAYILQRIKLTTSETINERVREFAVRDGLDVIDAMRAMSNAAIEAAVDKDYEEGIARGVSKTPTVFAGDKVFVEKFRKEDVAAAIDKALAALPGNE